MKEIFKYIALLIGLFAFGFFISKYFFDLSFFLLKNEELNLAHTNIDGQFNRRLNLAVSFGLIPVLFFFVNKLTKLRFFKQKLTAVLIIIFSGIVFWQYRILNLTNIINQSPNLGIKTSVDVDTLKLQFFFLLGLAAGAILSVLIFRIINSNNEK